MSFAFLLLNGERTGLLKQKGFCLRTAFVCSAHFSAGILLFRQKYAMIYKWYCRPMAAYRLLACSSA